MYTHKSRFFLIKNHLKSVLGSTRYQSRLIHGREWTWLEAGSPRASETVVLLHGLAMSKNHWRVVMPILAKHFRIIVPDIPGFQIGTAVANPEQGLDGLTKELTLFIDSVIDQPTHLVGHSMAATVATGLALRMPVPVRSVTLVSLAESTFNAALAKVLQARTMSEFMRDYTEQDHIVYVRSMFHRPTSSLDLIARHSWRNIRNHKQSIADLCVAMESELNYLENYAGSLLVPMLIVNGQQDLWQDLTRDLRFFSGPNIQRLDLNECCHLPFLEQPIQFSEALLQFLLSIRSIKGVA